MHRIATIVGARPQFIKAASVSRALRKHGDIVETIVHTGQHFDDAMSSRFFRDFDMEQPSVNLGVSGSSHGDMTGRMLIAIEAHLLATGPDAVIVFGDTNSTLAGGLAAAKLHIPVIHVEAGLRSRNMRMPEEVNRILTDHLSSLLLCPTPSSVANLKAENITCGVEWVGDVMMDMALNAVDAEASEALLRSFKLEPGRYALATIHRAENTDDPARFHKILTYLHRETAGLRVVLPLHPRLRGRVDEIARLCPQVMVLPAQGYFETQCLISQAMSIFTDSGGLTKEAMFHRVPCVTLRDETEWTETIEAGWNRLWTSPGYLPRTDTQAFGDGRAGPKVAGHIASFLAGAGR